MLPAEAGSGATRGELPGGILPAGFVFTDQIGGVESQHNAVGDHHNYFLLIYTGRFCLAFVLAAIRGR